MIYVWVVVGFVVLALSGALWFERDRANDATEKAGLLSGRIEKLTNDVKQAESTARSNRELADWWRDETVRAGLYVAEVEEKAAKVAATTVVVVQEIYRAPKAADPLPPAYDVAHRWMREGGGAPAARADTPGGRPTEGAPSVDAHPSAFGGAGAGGKRR